MADIDAAIAKYVSTDIALDQKDISAAAKSREWFLARLHSEIGAMTTGPQLYAPEPFINFGSYFKGTKVQNVDEFDILVVIDSNHGVFSIGGTPIAYGNGSKTPNHRYDPQFMKADGSGVSPSKFLEWLRAIVTKIVRSYGGDSPVRDGQAITVRIASQDLSIDLVPAGVFTRASDGSTFYNIAAGSGDDWRRTSPRIDIEQLESVADGKQNFRNLIRLAKRIRDTYKLDLSSFAIETALVNYGRSTKWSTSIAIEVRYGLRSLANAIESGTIPDPYESNENLIAGANNRDGSTKLLRAIAGYLERLGKASLSEDELYSEVRAVFE